MAKKNVKVAKTAYQAAAEELNDVMGLEPAIDVTLDDVEILPFLKEAISEIDPEDEISAETQEVIDALNKPTKKEKKAAAMEVPANKSKKVAEPDPEEEEEEEDDDEEPEVVPAKKGKAAPAKKEVAKAAVKATPAKKVAEPKKEKEHTTTRPEAVGLALQTKPKTLAAWIQKADDIYVKAGGLSNVSKMGADIKYMTKTLEILGVDFPAT